MAIRQHFKPKHVKKHIFSLNILSENTCTTQYLEVSSHRC